MSDIKKDIGFKEWGNLSLSEKGDILNHYWNPYEPEIGLKTKREIVENFINSTNINGLQFGLKYFGWGIYMLFVIVENSRIRVPKNFADISVNKGIVTKWIDKYKIEVKFNYGGITTIELNNKIVIKMNQRQRTTHNIKQLGFSGLRAFGSRFSILVGGQERSPKTQPFHIVKRL